MENKMAAIWARVSSRGQRELSLDGQVTRVMNILVDMGYTVIEDWIFKVVWSSLDLEPCPQFRELRHLISGKKIKAVGFFDRDRIEAVGLQRLMFLADCKENGVEPIICQGPPFVSEPEGQLVEMALAIGKERQVGRAQSGAKQGLFDRAWLKNLPPTKAQVYGMKWENGVYVPNEHYENACLVFSLWFDRCNLDYVGKELLLRGIPSPRGRIVWQSSSLTTLLKNPIYAGRVATLRYEKIEPKQRRKETSGKTSSRIKPESDWHYLDGLVKKPIITWDQHLAIKERLRLNKIYASRNAHHPYLLRGLIKCQLCGRHYFGVQPTSGRAKYYCNKHWAVSYGEKCPAKSLDREEIESAVKDKIRDFLTNPEVYLKEIRSRLALQENTKDDIEQTIRKFEIQYRDTIEDERTMARKLSEEAFKQERKLILARRNWLSEEIDRQRARLETLEKFRLNQAMVEHMRERLEHNLERATDEDWRFVLEALGTKILAFGDGNWDIEISIPIPEPKIENKTPWCISPG